jgi:hypothetical protein
MIGESTGDPSWYPTIPNRPGTLQVHLEGYGIMALSLSFSSLLRLS